MQLSQQQAAEPVDLSNPYLADETWDMEALVLETIAGQLEDDDEEEEDDTPVKEEDAEEFFCCETAEEEPGPFDGWALGSRGARQDECCAVACTGSCTPSAGSSSAQAGNVSNAKRKGTTSVVDHSWIIFGCGG